MPGIIYSNKYNLYNLGPAHPFSPLRTEMLIDLISELGYETNFKEPGQLAYQKLYEIHDPKYVYTVEELSKGKKLNDSNIYGLGTQDNPITIGMAEGARYQSSGTLLGAKLLIENKEKKILNLGGGFHHAHKNFASGFCIYNDLALAIKEMIRHGWHVIYLDIDVHHGDGVQEMFYSDENIMTISIHESGEYLFPGSGWLHELGKGMGRSLKLNLPLEPFTEGDSYLEVFDKTVTPALSWFKPDAIIIQTGVDAHFSDPLADILLTTYDYEKLFKRIIELSDEYCKGRAIFTLGGGYSITAATRIWAVLYFLLNNIPLPENLPEKWRNKWSKKLNKNIPELLHDKLPAYVEVPRKNIIEKTNRDLIQRLLDAVSSDWL